MRIKTITSDLEKETESGFTLFETLIIVVIITILSSLIAPAWLARLERSRVSQANDAVYSNIRLAQTKSQTERRSWQFSIRDGSTGLEFAVHPRSSDFDTLLWEPMSDQAVQIDSETTFAQSGSVYYVRFDEDGDISYRLGRMTLSSRRAPSIKYCVVVSTVIGAIRKSKDKAEPQDGRFCY